MNMGAAPKYPCTMNGGATQQTEQRAEEKQGRSAGASGLLSSVSRYARTGARSGLVAGIAGLVTVGRVRRALREGSSERAIRQGMMAVFWVGVAMTQWGMNRSSGRTGRPSGVGASDVVDTLSHVGGVSAGSGEERSDDSMSIDVTELNRTPDVEGDGPDADVEGNGPDADVEETDVDTEPNVEDVAAAEGVEQAQDAEGIEDVEDAEGVTALEETTDSDDEDEPNA